MAALQSKIYDDKSPAHLLDKLSFGSYNRGIKNKQTKFDWLSRDRERVSKYVEDELCGFISPINFYSELFNALPELYRPERLEAIRKDLPILILSGDKDPVGKYGKSVTKLYGQYHGLGMGNVKLKLFAHDRHELLNEINKEEVFEYVVRWLAVQPS